MMDRHETLAGITVLIKSDNSFVLETKSRRVDSADKSCALLTSKKETGLYVGHLKSIYLIVIIRKHMLFDIITLLRFSI